MYTASVVLRELGDHWVTATMPLTPLVVFNILFVISVAYGLYLGLEVFARATEATYPFFIITLLAASLFLLPHLNFRLLRPVFVHTPLEMLRASLNIFSYYGESIALLFLLPSLRHQEQASGINYRVAIYFTVPMLMFVIGEITVFGAEETSRLVFPSFELVKMITVAGFFERIESFLLSFWATTVILKVMLLYYVALVSFATAFGLPDYRHLIVPGAIIMVPLSLLVFADVGQARQFLSTTWNVFATLVEVATPLLLLTVAAFKQKGRAR